jgi:CheY-like chemotaxis protein
MNTSNTILLVEDDDDDVFLFKRALKTARITNEVNVATDGQAAIDYLSSAVQGNNPDKYPLPFIMFLDLKMPHVDGFEVLSWMRSQPSLDSLVVVVLTGSNQPRDHQRAYALGARSYLVKPAKPEEIREFIESMGSRWGQNENASPVAFKK